MDSFRLPPVTRGPLPEKQKGRYGTVPFPFVKRLFEKPLPRIVLPGPDPGIQRLAPYSLYGLPGQARQ